MLSASPKKVGLFVPRTRDAQAFPSSVPIALSNHLQQPVDLFILLFN